MNQQLQYAYQPEPLPWWCQLGWQLAIMAAVDVAVTLLLHVIPAL
jgi:hypothetical protein